ncbi:DUF4199 domain-containing protein [Sinomicrobium pectinilyticum]|uniref:DUF4199 domain-containing protein n=1 Tax=Sinomicrobium pectinilyticum TaxID=1084421 RepID=A0A3N0E222_SINP1|nr:DUF4199 domain-containing protein [Sinomicrobium pectinilyticum]RNL81865.1 DUF4199 domain-containing protein [Sinomicrobium pectinilyticum]
MGAKHIHLRYGIVTAIVLIAYFLIVKLFDLHENIWLRLLNGVIVGYGIYASIRFKRLVQREKFDYYAGATTGIFTGFIATLIFVGFMSIYMFHLDPAFPETIMNTWIESYNQGPGILLFIIAVEGFASSVVLTLAFMQKFKPSWNLSRKIPQKA